MAQSKIARAGSIFSRLDGLLKSGLIPWKDRPVWYDVYKKFPPARDPIYRTVLGTRELPPLPPKILYAEDMARAVYYKIGKYYRTKVLNSQISKTTDEYFVEIYMKRIEEKIKAGSGDGDTEVELNESVLVKETLEEMQRLGVPFILKKALTDRILSGLEKTKDQLQSDPYNQIDKMVSELDSTSDEIEENNQNNNNEKPSKN